MKSIKAMKVGALMFVLILMVVPVMNAGSAMEIKGGMHASIGDYVTYEVDRDSAANLIESMASSQFNNGSVTVNVEKAEANVKFTSQETIEVNGKSYKCMISAHNMEIKGSLSGSMQGMDFTGDLHMIEKDMQWVDENGATVKSENTEYMFINVTVNTPVGPHSQNIASKTVTVMTFDPPMNEMSGTVKVGDKWTSSSNVTVKTTQYSMANGQWQQEGSVQTSVHTETSTYEAVKEVTVTTKAGTFQTIEIKMSYSSDPSGNYTLAYVTEDGVPVKMETYSNGELVMSEEATEYHFADAKAQNSDNTDESSSTPGFEAFVALAAIGMAGIAYAHRRK